MTFLSSAEKAILAADAVSTFEDTCSILQWAAGTSGGHYKDTWPTTVSNVSCGFKLERGYSENEGRLVVINGKAQLRFSLAQSLDIKDKILIRGSTWKIGNILKGLTVKIAFLEMDTVNA